LNQVLDGPRFRALNGMGKRVILKDKPAGIDAAAGAPPTLSGKKVVVIGGSRGLGRVIVEAFHAEGARVLAVARNEEALARVMGDLTGSMMLALDATLELAPAMVFNALNPDVLILCAGSIPPTAPLHEQDWKQFSVNWETDVKSSFHFCKAALRLPLKSGALIVLISSGAAIGGSPISGGYAGAKRMQMFIANYCQKESTRLGLGLRFIAIAPSRIMPETGVGRIAVAGYSRYLGISPEEFLQAMSERQTTHDVASAIVGFANQKNTWSGTAFMVSGHGIEKAP
jgi:NAD(P)-dependent dehydrogenase (short-subunit alcohol dehydrogenase family)